MDILKKARLELKEGNSSKFYQIELYDNPQGSYDIWVTYGKIGAKNPKEEMKFSEYEEEEVSKEFDKLLSQKLKKGYQEVAFPESELQMNEPPVIPVEDIQNFDFVQLLKDHIQNYPKFAKRSLVYIVDEETGKNASLDKFLKDVHEVLSGFEIMENPIDQNSVEYLISIPLEDEYNVADLSFIVGYDINKKEINYQAFHQ